jgi:hypothetical protein
MVDPAFAEYATHIARNQNFILLHSTLNEDAEEIVSRASSTGNNVLIANIIYEKIGECINHHNAILE